MANAIVTIIIMPESPEADLEKIKVEALEILRAAGSKGQMQGIITPIAFGLNKLELLAMFEVKEGQDFEACALKMQSIPGVGSAEFQGMDLALG